MHAEEY